MRGLETPFPGLRLGAEVAGGGIAYTLSALIIARRASRDFLGLVKGVLRRRK
jgi:PST family polysaccharide transporter